MQRLAADLIRLCQCILFER